jgi:hypothetical protein
MVRIMCHMTENAGPAVDPDAPAESAWIPSTDDFGARLAMVRHKMGWNVKEAARECGLPAATWRLWEVDGALPRNIVTIGMAIAQRTGCDYLWLVHGPSRGAQVRTTAYLSRIVRRVPVTPAAERASSARPAAYTGPVRQTYPVGRSSRPLSRVAV